MPAPLPSAPSLAEITTQTLHKLLLPCTSTKGTQAQFQNWATTFKSQTLATFRPRCVEEVRWVVELARREGVELRPSGSGHSPSDLVCTEGYVVNLDKIDEVYEIDPVSQTFHAAGGIKLSALHPVLRNASLAISSLGSISDQTLAGAIATATHGSGVTYGNLSSCVTFLDLVLPLPNAPLVRVSREEDPELFLAGLCGLGSLGVVVGVGMRVERAFKLEEEFFTVKWDDFVDRWREIAESAEHVRCFWFPQVGQVKVSRLRRTTKAISAPPGRVKEWVISQLVGKHWHALVLTIARAFPRLLPYHAHFMWNVVERPAPLSFAELFNPVFPKPRRIKAAPVKIEIEGEEKKEKEETGALLVVPTEEVAGFTPPLTPEPRPIVVGGEAEVEADEGVVAEIPMLTEPTYRVDISDRIFNYDCGFPQYTYEGAVPYSQTGACLESLDAWLITELNCPQGLRSHFPIEIRFTEKDDIWLSPTYNQRATYIGAIQYRPFNLPVPYKKYFKMFEKILLQHEGRPHWAKSHTVGRVGLGKLYERLEDWLEVRERVDPGQVLVNPYVRRHLLGEVGEECDTRRFKSTGR